MTHSEADDRVDRLSDPSAPARLARAGAGTWLDQQLQAAQRGTPADDFEPIVGDQS